MPVEQTIKQAGNVSPFAVSKIGETGFVVNAGRIFSPYNPLNYAKARYTRDGDYLVNINKTSAINQIYLFPDHKVQIDVYVWATLKIPEYWIPGRSFIPDISRAWIVLAFTANNGTISYQNDLYGDGDFLNVNADSIFMDSDMKAANIIQIARFVKNSSTNGLWEYVQTWNEDIPLYFLIDWKNYVAYSYFRRNLGLDADVSLEQSRIILDGIYNESTLSRISRPSVINRGNFMGDVRPLSLEHYEGNFVMEPIL